MGKTTWTGKKPTDRCEETVDVLHLLSWTAQPPLGIIKGEYFREECSFTPHYAGDPGYHGVLEVVKSREKIIHVEYNEYTSPSYYMRLYQGVSKRRSSYCFYQATKARTAHTLKVLNNGICEVERQMVEQNRLTGPFDLVTGASNSVKRALLPLAAKIDAVSQFPSTMQYYGYAEKLGDGITARLQIVLEGGKIINCFYDEIFADRPEEIEAESLKKYYRQSKYYCLEYESPYPDGFNTIFDLLNQKVLLTQDLMDLKGLPWTEDTDKRKRNPEWDNYLRLAAIIKSEMEKDGIKS
jgi:hypothetical protein